MDKILVAYDGGDAGRRALRLAARLAHCFGARLDVVSVVPEGFGRVDGAGEEPAIVHARDLVEARALLRDLGIDAGLIEPSGDPALTIERLAEEGRYDTIVLGHTSTASDHASGTSIPAHIMSHAAVDVVVAR